MLATGQNDKDSWDEWHPDTWAQPLPYAYVFLHERNESLYVLVAREDWPWVCRHIWCPVGGQRGVYYAARRGPRPWRPWILLHLEVLKRMGPRPENGERLVGDHINGRSFDCRRQNLRWLTDAKNKSNRHERSSNQGRRTVRS